ncbi:S-layer homology domain-containing protein [Caminicella sporogenes DSM 14501]|uniref:S-layer homology domain-containing protein n=1 Tax=Caminicella sporogenes DSM 14501 TaxID=1121266 RepID=A0A1M6PQT1_9FIRM|nr:S-layer homology domain-containing protein [Caminicella sporogenes]RKD22015.1 S-layer protein [Caminicella sporogenes]SHK10241.1 S-layer homology domain-containing protein [Caminicella sporogenes DSM 14501]
MKKILIFTIIFLVFLSFNSYASPVGFTGGVNDEYEYEEVVFITGEPIKFTGQIKINEREKNDVKTVNYRFDLKPEDKSIKGKLTRNITVETKFNNRNDKGQAIGQTSLTKFSEKIEIGDDKFELKDYQFSKSDIIDKRPASDFYSGNIKGRKYYTINKDEGKVVVDISGGDVGYENFWGSTETQILNYYINYEKETDDTKVNWNGTVKVQVSDSLSKKLKYSDNMVNLSSFNGGYIKVTDREIISKYEYNLPRLKDGIPYKDRRNSGEIELSKKMVPKIERLIVPKFRDVNGHWAESYIEKLYSLDVFDEKSEFFTPDIPMTRLEFTRAIIKACDIRTLIDKKDRRSRRTKQEVEKSPFVDISADDKDYVYIKEGLSKGIIQGTSSGIFNPEGPLTRAQAITIIIRALGFNNKAPNPGYFTSFDDDRNIPDWARDSIYVAREIGIIRGDDNNRVYPNKVMTRAEASAMLVRFLEFLEKDLQKDYRENIVLFN